MEIDDRFKIVGNQHVPLALEGRLHAANPEVDGWKQLAVP
jgi:hypothetical protein